MASEQDIKCFLRIRAEHEMVQEAEVQVFPCTIGRASDNGIVIPHGSVSGHHACLEVRDGVLYLVDKGSTNGLYLDGKKWPEIAIRGIVRVILGRVSMDIAFSKSDLDDMPVMVPLKPQEVVPKEEPKSGAAAFSDEKTVAEVPTVPGVSSMTFFGDVSTHRDETTKGIKPIRDWGGDSVAFSRGGSTEKKRLVCPHCWHQFDMDEVLFIARHQNLIGDSVLGSDAPQRFLPSRFTPEGNAIDAAGMSCPDMACPRCHLRIPQSASEMAPLFLSIVGATASGKSYFLTSMCWEMRNTLPRDFAISFTDTDAVNNQILNDFEETIFLSPEPDELVALRKTELQGELYNQVLLDNMLINLPRPFMFTVTPSEHHPRYDEVKNDMSRTLVLYDNAGEHFEPGMDSADNPTTQHLLQADMIFFLFDPTKDVRFRRRLTGVDDPQLSQHARVQRQEIILTEMISRIKKYSGMHGSTRSKKSLVILVSKFDAWRNLLDMELPEEPWQWVPEYNTSALDIPFLRQVSFCIRQMLYETCPEVVTTAEGFADEVMYFPNSALGHSPELDDETGLIGIRPRDVAPFWATVPMLYFFYERGFIQSVPQTRGEKHEDTPCQCRLSGDTFFVSLPGRSKPLLIPRSFAGSQLRCPGTDIWFTLPEND